MNKKSVNFEDFDLLESHDKIQDFPGFQKLIEKKEYGICCCL